MNSGATNCSYYMQGEQWEEGICYVEIQIFLICNKNNKSNFCAFSSPQKKVQFPQHFMVSLRVTIISKRGTRFGNAVRMGECGLVSRAGNWDSGLLACCPGSVINPPSKNWYKHAALIVVLWVPWS